MKRQRSYSEDLMDGEGNGGKEWVGRRDLSEGTKMRSLKGLDCDGSRAGAGGYKKSSYGGGGGSSRNFGYENEGRASRKRIEVEAEGFVRSGRGDGYGAGRVCSSSSSRRGERGDAREGLRKGGGGFERTEVSRSSRGEYRDGGSDSAKGSPRRLHSAERARCSRSGSFSKRENYENLKFVGKGSRSERERGKRDDARSYGSEGGFGWRRSSSRDVEEDYYHRSVRGGNESSLEDRLNGSSGVGGLSKSPQESKETEDSVKGAELRKGEGMGTHSSSDEMEEGELEPDLEPEPEPESEPRVEQHVEQDQDQDQEQQSGSRRESEPDPVPEQGNRSQEENGEDQGKAHADPEDAREMKEDADSEHIDGEVGSKDIGNGERGELGKEERVNSMSMLDKENDAEEMGDLEMTSDDPASGSDSARKCELETNNEGLHDLNEVEMKQQTAEECGMEERKGANLEAESTMGTAAEASNEPEKAEEKCKELTFSFLCDMPKTVSDDPVKTDAGYRGELKLKSIGMEVEEMGKDKDQGLALSLSNGAFACGKWEERALLISNERKKKAPEEAELGNGTEGTSSRGLQRETHIGTKLDGAKMELSNDVQRQKKPKLEPLQLSLGLPDVSLTLASPNMNAAPASPSRGRSFQSLSHTAHTTHSARTQTARTQTGSDAFTTSISFSGSQTFVHNPSCSNNQNSMDNYEYSVGSHPSFQGNSDQVSHGNWNATYSNEQTSYDNNVVIGGASQDMLKQRREVPLYQRILQNGNLPTPQVSQGMFGGSSRGQASSDRDSIGYDRAAINSKNQGNFSIAQGQQVRNSERSLGRSNSLERQAKYLMAQEHQARSSDGNLGRYNGPERHAVFPRELSEQWKEVRSSPTQSVGSREKGSDQRKQINRDSSKSDRERAVIPQKGHQGRCVEQSAPGAFLSIERILNDIITEPIPVISQRLQDMPSKALQHLRDCLGELIEKNEKCDEFFALQRKLQRRTDLTQEMLLQAHRVQLEILVALKTGIQAFLLHNNLPSLELVEVFLQSRCRNMACKSILPVDDCECKICSQKSGFCSACMCLVCSKFDFASNTCSWVGCDVCLHWCHTDCGIRMSHIRNGRSINGAPGTTEMQFHCIGCEHASEMFGFVKEVFKTCAKGWDVETLAKELDCVRRIFQESEDPRGKQLWSKSEQALAKLESKADPSEVCISFIAFLAECDAKITTTSSFSAKEPVRSNQGDASNRVPITVREAVYNIPSGSNEKIGTSATSERARTVLQNYDREVEGRPSEAVELQYNRSRNKAEIDELESIVRIKQAEAKMFQVRADDARREAEGLKRIAIAKNEKIEEEYACKLAKLCLAEVEERRRHKLEELQILERAQRDYFTMKMRMEADIKDLLMKMDATKRRF
uniref:TSA: Wollemia nobilis Ref_Wollemi_Transcript_9027_4695 transcribed RNA sequence n=1 Tax=Wollemia nobilis TaxID=56998 RepID=A0A0C9RWD0_9CONI